MYRVFAASAAFLAVASCALDSETTGSEQPPTQVVWAFLGDSSSDEYRADDDRPALNYTELLAAPSPGSPPVAHHRGVDAGEWGRRGEPRREGFANVWARSSSTMREVVREQLPGVLDQIGRGEVTHVYLSATGNEWATRDPFLIRTIYESPDGGMTTSDGVLVSRRVQELFELYAECIDSLAPAAAGVVVAMPAQWQDLPQLRQILPDGSRRSYIGAAIDDLNRRIRAHSSAINEQLGRTAVVTTTYDAVLRTHYASDDGATIEIAGVRLDYTRNAPRGEPGFLLIAPDSRNGSPHLGTVANGAIANTFIAAANQLPGVTIEPFSDREIRENAGL